MKKPRWEELAIKGLERALPPDRVESARSAIDLRLMLGAPGLRRHPAFQREICIFTLFAGQILRIVVETGDDIVIWHIGVQTNSLTE